MRTVVQVSFSEIIGMDIQEISLCVSMHRNNSLLRWWKFLSKIGSIRFESCYCQNGKSKEYQKRLLSKSCLLFRLRTNSCKNCCYTAKLYRNRSTKRKRNSSCNEVPHKNCNTRYPSKKDFHAAKRAKERIEKRSSNHINGGKNDWACGRGHYRSYGDRKIDQNWGSTQPYIAVGATNDATLKEIIERLQMESEVFIHNTYMYIVLFYIIYDVWTFILLLGL